MTKRQLSMVKMIAANVVAILLVMLLTGTVMFSLSGSVDLKDPTTSMFVGSLIGNICGLLQAPMVWYFGQAIINKDQGIVRRQSTGGAE